MRCGLWFVLGCLVGCHDVWDLVRVESDAGPPVDMGDSDATIATRCPSGFQGRYAFFSMDATWEAARDFCARLDEVPDDDWFTHLVVISDEPELMALSILEYEETWVGYTDIAFPAINAQEANFRWITDEPGHPNPWKDSGDPDSSAYPRCGYLEGDGTVHDAPCGEGQAFMCECDQFAENPKNFTPPL